MSNGFVCDICGRILSSGMAVSHSPALPHSVEPNVQRVRRSVNGTPQLSTSAECLRPGEARVAPSNGVWPANHSRTPHRPATVALNFPPAPVSLMTQERIPELRLCVGAGPGVGSSSRPPQRVDGPVPVGGSAARIASVTKTFRHAHASNSSSLERGRRRSTMHRVALSWVFVVGSARPDPPSVAVEEQVAAPLDPGR